ncbi:MAG: hypothetical protein H7Y88_10160 [Phycisphaerales bacterium]|nr:hypothetical protein [Phycisphaerales bacterium]
MLNPSRPRPQALSHAAAAVATLTLSAGALALHQPDSKPQQPPPGDVSNVGPVFVAERAGLDAFLVDERDSRLKAALKLIPTRLAELPQEFPELHQIPMPMVHMGLALLSNPGRISLSYNPADQTRGGFGIGLVLSSLTKNQGDASKTHDAVNNLMVMANVPFQSQPSKEFSGMGEMTLPFGLLRYGPRKASDGSRYEVHFGSVSDPEAAFTHLPAPRAGFTPVLRARMDFAPLTPLMNMFKMMAAGTPQAGEMFEKFEKSGFTGPNAKKFTFMMGHTAEESLCITTVEGARQFAELGLVATEPLTTAELAVIPADAVVASIAKWNPASLRRTIDELMVNVPQAVDFREQFQEHTGVDFIDDILATIGGTASVYMSDTTGGGLTLGSLVAVISLNDSNRLHNALTKLEAHANAMVNEHHHEVRGHVAFKSWNYEGHRMHTLMFPGLPIPFELTYAISDKWLVFGVTPQGVVAAAQQASGKGGPDLASRGVFNNMVPKTGAISLSYVDTERTMGRGYPLVTMLGSAVSNFARSPLAPDREPGMIVPPFNTLKQGARPRISLGYWDGDNLVYVAHGNRSVLVDAAGVFGAMAPAMPFILGGIGAAAAAIEQRQQMEMMHTPDDFEEMEEDDAVLETTPPEETPPQRF